MKQRVSAKWQMQTFDDLYEKDDPMGLQNNVVRRAHIKTEVICAVLCNGESMQFETLMDFNAAEYALKAHGKFGACRVIFYQANEGKMWREIRWKNANVGSLYKRPSFMTLSSDQVPDHLRLAAMLL